MSTKLQIIKQIKKKPELSYIDNSLISQVLENYLDKYKISLKNLKPSQQKTLVKEIRAQLRLYTGRFQKGTKKRDLLLKQNKISDLLKTHTSTAERLSFYPELKKLIEKLKVKSILDLGCGLNPIALANKDIKYNASDVQTSDLKLVGTFFKKNKISGKVFMNNLLKIGNPFPKTDLCLLFKVLDIIEKKGHKLAEKIILSVEAKYLLISFSTKTLSGKIMSSPRRRWLENLLKHHKIKYKTITSQNEIFYLAQK